MISIVCLGTCVLSRRVRFGLGQFDRHRAFAVQRGDGDRERDKGDLRDVIVLVQSDDRIGRPEYWTFEREEINRVLIQRRERNQHVSQILTL